MVLLGSGQFLERFLALLFLQALPLILALDYGNFALPNGVSTTLFSDPGVAPPSFIFGPGQLRPPYYIEDSIMEPFAGCSALYADLCAVQHAIRLVTRAREAACGNLAVGGDTRMAAIANLSAGSIAAADTAGFGIMLLSQEGEILADALRPDLIGTQIDGLASSGRVPQTTLLDAIDYVVGWGGGFVPHYSTRFESEAGTAPAPVAAYVEGCPGNTQDRLAVIIGREPIPAISRCDPMSNTFCSLQNMRRIAGRMLLDMLVGYGSSTLSDVIYANSHTDKYKVGSFYVSFVQMSWLGYPGEDPLSNPGPLANTMNTYMSHASQPQSLNGQNLSDIWVGRTTEDGVDLGLWLTSKLAEGAWTGGAMSDYDWHTDDLGDHLKAALAFGIVTNGTALRISAGTVHRPGQRSSGPLCSTCRADLALTCTLVDVKSLVSHARMDILTPTGSWERLTYKPWFGAFHDDIWNETADLLTFPEGIYAYAISCAGTCVANGYKPELVGQNVSSLLGNDSVHEAFIAAADSGGNWVVYNAVSDDEFFGAGSTLMAYATKVRVHGQSYYIAVPMKKAIQPLDLSCSSTAIENCSISNAEVLTGYAAASLLTTQSKSGFLEVSRQLVEQTGDFSSAKVGDFQVLIYSSVLDCWDEFGEAGIACPPTLSHEAITILSAALEEDAGTWSQVTIDGVSQAVFAFRINWKPKGSVDETEFFLLSFLVSNPARPSCDSDDDCPARASCSASTGRCECNSEMYQRIFLEDSSCRGLEPSGMECLDISGQDCSSATNSAIVDLQNCRECGPGYFCQLGLPAKCPAGQHCPAGSNSPTSCPAGSFANSSGLSECTLCSTGYAMSQAGAESCNHCRPGTYAGAQGQLSCDLCPIGSYSDSTAEESCRACPGGTLTAAAGASSVRDCRLCTLGSFYEDGRCSQCFWGFTTTSRHATSCSMPASLEAALIASTCSLLAVSVIIVLLSRRFQSRLALLQRQAEAAAEQKVSDCLENVEEFGYPLVLMSASQFKTLTMRELSTRYEGNRSAHRLVFVDTYSRFKEHPNLGRRTVFFSYHSASERLWGPDGAQLELMQRSLEEAISSNEWEEENTYVWLDVFSVPQEREDMKRLAITSLHLYTKCADALLVIPPNMNCDNSIQLMAMDNYEDRGWMRAEVMAYCCNHGVERVYLAGPERLKPATLEWALDMSSSVFTTKMWCCQNGHSGGSCQCQKELLVAPFVALYFDIKSRRHGSIEGIRFFNSVTKKYKGGKDIILPPTYEYTTWEKKSPLKTHHEVRTLFGDLLLRVERRVAASIYAEGDGSLSWSVGSWNF